jgi:hypothetical protein
MNLKKLIERIPPSQPEPVEVRDAILEEIEKMIEQMEDGRRRLPFNRLRITLFCDKPARRARLRRFLTAGAGIREDIVSICGAQHVVIPPALSVEIAEKTPEPQSGREFLVEGWFEDPVEAEPRRAGQLILLPSGKTIPLPPTVFRIGREKHPTDRHGRSRAENHLFFGEEHLSVSRQHAEIQFNPATAEYRLWDLGSTQGTRIVRGSAEIDVPRSARSPGECLREGDLIYFGKVGVRFQHAPDDGSRG